MAPNEALAAVARTRRAVQEAREAAKGVIEDACADLFAQLRIKREQAGLTQSDISDVIGLTRQQIANMEAGRGASLQALVAYAAALDLVVTFAPVDD